MIRVVVSLYLVLALLPAHGSSQNCTQLLKQIANNYIFYSKTGRFPRESGVLMPITSLPGSYGIGELGPESKRFIDTLAKMDQKIWQILPSGPTSFGNSPYQSLSTFAGNPLQISISDLITAKYLYPNEVLKLKALPADFVDYGALIPEKSNVLKLAAKRFKAAGIEQEAFNNFGKKNQHWLDDYALFISLKNHFDGAPWYQWPSEYASRNQSALELIAEKFKSEIELIKIEQFFYHKQWGEVRTYANAKGVEIMGDIPIFVAHDSCDVWVNPHLFYLNKDGSLKYMAGVPPDAFSSTGQLWGNPLYNWKMHRQEGFSWWISRIMNALEKNDRIRIDHFRGFEAAWQVNAKATDASGGKWVSAPGFELFKILEEVYQKKYGTKLPMVLEDLGVITDNVVKLRDETGLPGMNIVQFFDNPAYRPDNFIENSVAYTSTHDNQTMIGYLEQVLHDDGDLANLLRTYTQATNPHQIAEGLITKTLESRSNTVIIPIQDLLFLGDEARINTPGKMDGNWTWRLPPNSFTSKIINWMSSLTKNSHR